MQHPNPKQANAEMKSKNWIEKCHSRQHDSAGKQINGG